MKTILCFGDSNTYGLNPADKSRFDYETRWTGILDSRFRSYGFHVAEEGLCGRTTVFPDVLRANRRGVDVLPFIIESHSPVEYVTLMLGTNDCKTAFNSSAYMISEGIKRLVKQIHSAGNAKILIMSPIYIAEGINEYDAEFDEKSVEISHQLKKYYSEIAEAENCLFLAASDYAKPSEYDREHMDSESHRKLAEAVFNTIYNDISKTPAGSD